MTTLSRSLLATWICLALLSRVVAADTPGVLVDPEIRKLFQSLELSQRFADERTGYMQFMQSQGTAGTRRVVHEIGQRLIAADYSTPLCTFLASRFSLTDAQAINAYLATPVGKRQLREMRSIHKEMRANTSEKPNVSDRVEKFKATLTDAEKKTIATFSATDAGKKYWAHLGEVDSKLSEIFSQLAEQVLARLAAESGVPAPSPGAKP